ncbi:hypothetical protein LOD99_3050 [Oopsacas minuta]|uniref:Anti-proliferative protein domain-containing protein n=1 Tax=Oopsacas minuta TaxID=111878 RepID=A0AAV7K1R4_9METZ|nr:hypothetical protein LOD99_3050 [Oopsacas minuta]
MIDEVTQAITFFRTLLNNSIPHVISSIELEGFTRKLRELLLKRFESHWDPTHPNKGSGYRCIRINHQLDPIVLQACQESGTERTVPKILPRELTVWIDPQEVAYRFGEEGSICKLESSPPSSPKSSPEPIRKEVESPTNNPSKSRSSKRKGTRKTFLATGSVTSKLMPRNSFDELSFPTISVNA